jgi:dihydrofolate reductase
MGRHTYDMAWGDLSGYKYQVPIVVLTHALPSQVARGQNDRLSVTFVTSGIQQVLAQTAQQCLPAGLVDEIHLGIVPVLLGGSARNWRSPGVCCASLHQPGERTTSTSSVRGP